MRIGKRTRIQSHSFICQFVTIGDDCFIGHGVMFANDLFRNGARIDPASWGRTPRSAIASPSAPTPPYCRSADLQRGCDWRRGRGDPRYHPARHLSPGQSRPAVTGVQHTPPVAANPNGFASLADVGQAAGHVGQDIAHLAKLAGMLALPSVS